MRFVFTIYISSPCRVVTAKGHMEKVIITFLKFLERGKCDKLMLCQNEQFYVVSCIMASFAYVAAYSQQFWKIRKKWLMVRIGF